MRTGNLNNFNQTLTTFSDKFSAEGTYTLIVRLRHNVIKTGVRMINLSYSRISLADIADKLQLDSPEDAEFIIAKVTVVGTAFVPYLSTDVSNSLMLVTDGQLF